ncbi:hypothetical protein WG954_00745 [Lacibacter sp. H375]|uniref:hypothetical protein n=1 Tax=Lacibacter sp. H375 TaxID=3133424 RepID=UPI0030BCBAF9
MTILNVIIGFLVLSLFSCETKPTITDKSINDTTRVLATVLEQAISVEFMPSASALKRVSKFSDSILLTADSLPLGLLPKKSGEQIFKVLPKETIYKILTGLSYRQEPPNYLCISRFEKSDTGYYVQTQNLSALPFGEGGSLGLYLKEDGDSLKIIKKSSWSIN